MSNIEANWSQANHTLTLIGQQKPNADHIKKLHDGLLTDLVEAIMEGKLPARDEIRKFYGLPELNPVIDCDAQPQIPDWADKDNPIIKHTECGKIDPSKLTTASVFRDGEEVLEGEEYITRAQKLKSLNANALEFYSQPENWKYLKNIPTDITVIVFAGTEFRRADGNRYVRYLFRNGASWHRDCDWIVNRFYRDCAVAVLAS